MEYPWKTFMPFCRSDKFTFASLSLFLLNLFLYFDFDLNIAVSEFKVKIPGQPSILINGNKFDDKAKAALRRASRGDLIQIFDIKADITNNKSYNLKTVSSVIVELVN